jgi:hypothetical protein
MQKARFIFQEFGLCGNETQNERQAVKNVEAERS